MSKYKRTAAVAAAFTICALYADSSTSEAAVSGQAAVPAAVQMVPVNEDNGGAFFTVRKIAEKTVQDAIAEAEERRAKLEQEAREQALREQQAREQAEREAREAEEFRMNQVLLAAIIFCEAGNQSYEGQIAVGAVVLNRVSSGIYPDTIRDVIYDQGQFGPAVTGWFDRVLAEESYTESAFQAAADALNGANPVGDCLYFDQGGYGMQIGAHYFH